MNEKQVMTRHEVEAFGSKLDAFGQQLNPKEQALFRHILLRAAAAQEADVQGYNYSPFTEESYSFSSIFAESNLGETHGIIIIGG